MENINFDGSNQAIFKKLELALVNGIKRKMIAEVLPLTMLNQ